MEMTDKRSGIRRGPKMRGVFRKVPDHAEALLFAAAAGLCLTAGFPAIGFWYAPWAAFALLFFAFRQASPAAGFWLGFFGGLVHFLTLLYWLVPTMRIYGYLPLPASVAALLLLCIYLSLYPALFGLLICRSGSRPALLILLAPTLWVGLEYLRAVLFTGFPWGLVGYSQFERLHLIQVADLVGVYGVSALVLFFNAGLFLPLLHARKRRWQGVSVSRGAALAGVLAVSAALGGAVLYGEERLKAVDHALSDAGAMEIAVIQGNIDQMQKWDKAFRSRTMEKYLDLTDKARREHSPDLIIWPETAAPFYFNYEADYRQMILDGVAAMETPLLIGAPSIHTDDDPPVFYNSAYLISGEAEVAGRYDKVHLVPFGEYVPFSRWLFFLDSLVAQVGNFAAGRAGDVLSLQERRIGVLICYESIFPGLSAEMTANGADILVNMTNDAWFGRTGAPRQHFSMAVFRAIENRRSLVRAANTGISGFIDPAGRVREASSLFKTTAISGPVHLVKAPQTFYTRWRDGFALACLVATAGLSVLYLFNSWKKR